MKERSGDLERRCEGKGISDFGEHVVDRTRNNVISL